jgi:DNA polymerase V
MRIFSLKQSSDQRFPLYFCPVSAGVPGSVDDYVESEVDLNHYLNHHPGAMFLVRVSGDSMIEAGICSEDFLIVDKSLEPINGDIVVAAVDGEMTVKRLNLQGGITLNPANQDHEPLQIQEETHLQICGVAIAVLHKLRKF